MEDGAEKASGISAGMPLFARAQPVLPDERRVPYLPTDSTRSPPRGHAVASAPLEALTWARRAPGAPLPRSSQNISDDPDVRPSVESRRDWGKDSRWLLAASGYALSRSEPEECFSHAAIMAATTKTAGACAIALEPSQCNCRHTRHPTDIGKGQPPG